MTRPAQETIDAAELDRRLSSIRFEPRASLGAEVWGHVRRARRPPYRPPRPGLPSLLGFLFVVVVAGLVWLWWPALVALVSS